MQVRATNGDVRDEIRQNIFDSFFLEAGVNPTGVIAYYAATTNKPKAQSNLQNPNAFPMNNSYRCLGFSLDAQNWQDANYQVLPLIMERSSLLFSVGDKTYWQGNCMYLCGRLDQTSALSQYGQVAPSVTARTYQRYGDVSVQAVGFTGDHALEIAPLQNFQANQTIAFLDNAEATAGTVPGGGQRIGLYFTMKGLLRRNVQ